MLFFLQTLQKIPILLSTVIFEFLLFHHTLFSFWVIEKEAKKEYVSRLTYNLLRQRSTIFNFYVLKMKREGKPALVKLQCFAVDLYGYKRHWL